MSGLLAFSRLVDWVNERIGRVMGWVVLLTVLVSAFNAISRYGWNSSSNAWLELQWYLFGAVFLLGAAYTLKMNDHIRIDIINSRLSQGARNVIELLGHVFFLMPLCILMLYLSVPFFWRAFLSGEVSSNAGGLPIWPAKLLLPLGFFLLTIQGVSEIIKRIAFMRGLVADPHDRANAS